MFMAVIVFLFATPGGIYMSHEVRPEDHYRTLQECVAEAGSAAALVVAQSHESIPGYSVICVRANEA